MARDFDGTNDQIVVADSATTSVFAGNFSIGIWFFPDAHNAGSLFVKGAVVTNMDVALLLSLDTQIYAAAGNHAGATVLGISTPAGQWHYIMMVRSSGANVSIYINDMTTSGGTLAGANNADSGADLYIGNDLVAGANPFNGRLANFILYDRALTEAERIQCKAGCPVPTSGLMAYLPLMGTTSPEPDISGNGNSGVVTEAAQIAHPPGIGACTYLGGAVPGIGSIHPIYPLFST